MASSQAVVPRTAVPRFGRAGFSRRPPNSGRSAADFWSLPCLASSTKQPRL